MREIRSWIDVNPRAIGVLAARFCGSESSSRLRFGDGFCAGFLRAGGGDRGRQEKVGEAGGAWG